MRAKVFWIGLAGLVPAGCEKKEEIPKATVVAEEEASEEQPDQPGEVTVEPLTPEVPPAPEPEENPTVGERVDRAIEATETGLQTAEERTREGVTTAAEKTEEGVRKGAEATGRFLKEVGERLEEAATGVEQEEPPAPPVEP